VHQLCARANIQRRLTLRVPSQLPRSFNRGSPAKAGDQIRMQAAQQVWGQLERAKAIEFSDLREQAFEAN